MSCLRIIIDLLEINYYYRLILVVFPFLIFCTGNVTFSNSHFRQKRPICGSLRAARKTFTVKTCLKIFVILNLWREDDEYFPPVFCPNIRCTSLGKTIFFKVLDITLTHWYPPLSKSQSPFKKQCFP